MKPLNSLSTPATAIQINRIRGRRKHASKCASNGDEIMRMKNENLIINHTIQVIPFCSET
jgi:hypothetical protein